MDTPNTTMARPVAQAASAFQQQRTRQAPTLRYAGTELSHAAVVAVARTVIAKRTGQVICLDLSEAVETCTAAFAELVLLRRALRNCGRDLRLRGLQGHVRGLWEITRLAGVLPTSRPEDELGLLAAAGVGGTCSDLEDYPSPDVGAESVDRAFVNAGSGVPALP